MTAHRDCYSEEGRPLECPACGCIEIEQRVEDAIDVGVGEGGIPCEISYHCANCGAGVGYWAYGSFDPAYLVPPP